MRAPLLTEAASTREPAPPTRERSSENSGDKETFSSVLANARRDDEQRPAEPRSEEPEDPTIEGVAESMLLRPPPQDVTSPTPSTAVAIPGDVVVERGETRVPAEPSVNPQEATSAEASEVSPTGTLVATQTVPEAPSTSEAPAAAAPAGPELAPGDARAHSDAMGAASAPTSVSSVHDDTAPLGETPPASVELAGEVPSEASHDAPAQAQSPLPPTETAEAPAAPVQPSPETAPTVVEAPPPSTPPAAPERPDEPALASTRQPHPDAVAAADRVREALDRLRPVPQGGAEVQIELESLGRVHLRVESIDGGLRLALATETPIAAAELEAMREDLLELLEDAETSASFEDRRGHASPRSSEPEEGPRRAVGPARHPSAARPSRTGTSLVDEMA